jgi:hypothetical protein
MSLDFLEDAIDKLDEGEFSYVVILQPKSGACARVLSDLGGWHTARDDISLKEDIHQLLDATALRGKD